MNTLELRENVINSFQMVKEDIRAISEEVSLNREEIHAINAQLSILNSTLREINDKLSGKVEVEEEVEDEKFISSKASKNFHRFSCINAKRINSKNKVKFDSRQEAKSAGKVECEVCLG